MLKIIFITIAALSLFGLAAYNFKKTDTRAASPTVESDSAVVAPDAKTPDDETKTRKGKTPVIVELFTSEGCSSCPPADKNLIYLNDKQPVADAEIITLSLHVDYWNRLGWTDKFSSAEYSERQSDYSNAFHLDGVYTPQIVVDGQKQFVGGNLDEARTSISEALNAPKAGVELSVAENKLNVKIDNLPAHAASKVLLAIAEDNLSTEVKRGENGGRTLPHASVVRELKSIGTIAAGDKSFATETAFELKPDWKKPNLKIVVFVQEESEKSSRIIGAAQIKL